jgi:hypothetical protein
MVVHDYRGRVVKLVRRSSARAQRCRITIGILVLPRGRKRSVVAHNVRDFQRAGVKVIFL